MAENETTQKKSLGKRMVDGVNHIQEFTISNTLKLAPFLITLAIFVTAMWFISATAGEHRLQAIFQSKPLQDSLRVVAEKDTVLLMRAQGSRLTWATFSNIHLLACAGAFLVGFWIFRKNWKHYSLSQQLRLVLFILSTVAFTLWAFIAQREVQQMGNGLLALTQDVTSKRLLEMTGIFDGISIVTASFLAVTSCALLMLPPPDKNRLTSTDLLYRARQQRLILYASAIVLVTGVLHSSSLFHLAEDYVPGLFVSLRSEMHLLVDSLVSSRAVYFSLVLAGIYLPGALFLQDKLKEASSTQETEQQQNADVARELAGNYADILPRAIAILAPLLTGPALDLLKSALGTG